MLNAILTVVQNHRQIIFAARGFIFDDGNHFRSKFFLGVIHSSVPQFKPFCPRGSPVHLELTGQLTDKNSQNTGYRRLFS